MFKWSPIKNIRNIGSSECIYIGSIEIYPQDSISGDISHGERKRDRDIFGIINKKENIINFIASFDIDDKYERLLLNGEHNITGIVCNTGKYSDTKYRIGFTCPLINLETCNISNGEIIKDSNGNIIKMVKGRGKIAYIPWSNLEPIEIKYYIYKNMLTYITFNLTYTQYNNWIDFKNAALHRYNYGNDIKV